MLTPRTNTKVVKLPKFSGGGFLRRLVWMSVFASAAITRADGGVTFQIESGICSSNWVTTWGCAPQLTEPGNLPPVPLANRTLRQFVRTTVGGKHLRVRFANIFGTDAITIRSVHLALAAVKGRDRKSVV